jgi:pimeloyl-ACP methyl ester carboxylesterase
MEATVLLVHGAYADASSWNGLLDKLSDLTGTRFVAFANPLRGLANDSAALRDLLVTIDGPVVLVGHSYGGAVMTAVPSSAADVRALVYVAGFALAPGESCLEAAALAPGSTLRDTIETVLLDQGGADTYIRQGRFHAQFCADLPADEARLMAIAQRPVTEFALSEPAPSEVLWSTVPSWFVFGELDHNIPAGAHAIMAERAKSRKSVEVPSASHVVGISHPGRVAEIVRYAVTSAAASTSA